VDSVIKTSYKIVVLQAVMGNASEKVRLAGFFISLVGVLWCQKTGRGDFKTFRANNKRKIHKMTRREKVPMIFSDIFAQIAVLFQSDCLPNPGDPWLHIGFHQFPLLDGIYRIWSQRTSACA